MRYFENSKYFWISFNYLYSKIVVSKNMCFFDLNKIFKKQKIKTVEYKKCYKSKILYF